LWFKVSGTGNTGWRRLPKSTVDAGDPEGRLTGSPGDSHLNTDDDVKSVKKTGTDTNTGWV
jgi:hypothetical protein